MITAEPLVLVPLYGKGAIIIHDEKTVYRPENGVIHVPPQLVERVLALGFSRFAPENPVVEVSTFPTSSDVAKEETTRIPPMGNDV